MGAVPHACPHFRCRVFLIHCLYQGFLQYPPMLNNHNHPTQKSEKYYFTTVRLTVKERDGQPAEQALTGMRSQSVLSTGFSIPTEKLCTDWNTREITFECFTEPSLQPSTFFQQVRRGTWESEPSNQPYLIFMMTDANMRLPRDFPLRPRYHKVQWA